MSNNYTIFQIFVLFLLSMLASMHTSVLLCAVMSVSGGGEEAQDGRELQAVASAATKTCCAWWP